MPVGNDRMKQKECFFPRHSFCFMRWELFLQRGVLTEPNKIIMNSYS